MEHLVHSAKRPFLPVDDKALFEASPRKPDHPLERMFHQVSLSCVIDLAPFQGHSVSGDVVVHLGEHRTWLQPTENNEYSVPKTRIWLQSDEEKRVCYEPTNLTLRSFFPLV